MAERESDYPSMQGMVPMYSGLDKQPDYHIVFETPLSWDPNELAMLAKAYTSDNSNPRVTLLFVNRGTVFVDYYAEIEELVAAISRVQAFPGIDEPYKEEVNFLCCFSKLPTLVNSTGRQSELLFDVDPQLFGQMIAKRAFQKFSEVKHRCSGMSLRWPNLGTVMVDQFDDDELGLQELSRAIQRARNIDFKRKLMAA